VIPDAIQPVKLVDFLESQTVRELKKLAGLLEAALPTRKAELVALIEKHLQDARYLRQLWDRLDEWQRAAIAETLQSGRFDAAAFRAKYGRDPDWGQQDHYRQEWSPAPLHLFIYGQAIIPSDLRKRLQAFASPPRPLEIATVDTPPPAVKQRRYLYDPKTRRGGQREIEVPITCLETERAAQHDVHAVLRLIEAGRLPISAKTRQVGTAGARAVAEVLQGGDFYPLDEPSVYGQTAPGPIKAFAWPLIVQAAGLANLAGNRLQLTPAGRKALQTAPHLVLRRTWESWQKNKLLDEFNRIHTIKGQGRRGALAPVAGRRAVVAAALRDYPANRWTTVDEFFRFIQATGHTFAVAGQEWYLYISDPSYGSLGYEGHAKWPVLQGRYILVLLLEYAATMGLIDVAYVPPSGARRDYAMWGTDDLDCLSRYDGLLYLRINGLGAWCLGQTADYAPAPLDIRRAIRVLPNHEIVALEPLPPGDVLLLERFAERTADAVWRIERTRVIETIEQGYSGAEIGEFLEARSGDHLPGNVAVFLRETAERVAGLVDRGPAHLIAVQDPALVQLIANDRRLGALCMPAGERHLVVPEETGATFRRLLRELGYGVSAPRKRDPARDSPPVPAKITGGPR
jgi:hypothetical protein